MAAPATSLPSAARQTGTTLGVAISGTTVGPALVHGETAFTSAEHGVWWLVLGLGAGILVLALASSGRRARGTATRAAALFNQAPDTDEDHNTSATATGYTGPSTAATMRSGDDSG